MSRRRVVLCVLALSWAVLATSPGWADVGGDKATLQRDKATLQHIRQLSGRYHSIKQAKAAGYVADMVCVSVPGLGGMGYHYVNVPLIDKTLDIDHPEVLLFASKPGGGHRLIGVEYVVVAADQTLATSGDRPVLAGHPFDGPMPGHFPGMPVHYDLHVWAWADNPMGSFATWNPAITCP